MPLTQEVMIDITLLTGSGPTRHITCTFNTSHRTQIIYDTVVKGIKKFKRTGSVADATRSGTLKTETDDDTSTQAIAGMARNRQNDPTSLFANANQSKQCHTYFAG